jgi:hypothetical protein
MKKIYYEKIGKKYFPVAEYDPQFENRFRKGTHLVHCIPNGASYVYDIDPNHAAVIASSLLIRNTIIQKIVEASAWTTGNQPITLEQKAAWKALSESFGDSYFALQSPSITECVDAGIKEIQATAHELMKHDGVKKAFDNFQLMCKLVEESPVDS